MAGIKVQSESEIEVKKANGLQSKFDENPHRKYMILPLRLL